MLSRENHVKRGITVQRPVETVQTTQRSKVQEKTFLVKELWLKQNRWIQRRFEKYRRKKKRTIDQIERAIVRQQCDELLQATGRKGIAEKCPTKTIWNTEEAAQMKHKAKPGANYEREYTQKQLATNESYLRWTAVEKRQTKQLEKVNFAVQEHLHDLSKAT